MTKTSCPKCKKSKNVLEILVSKPLLQQLPVSSVSTKCFWIDSTKYSCVQFDSKFDVQFSTSVVNKLHCTFAWICVDFSWKRAFISYHVMSAKTCVLKCCCLLLTELSFEKVRCFYIVSHDWLMVTLERRHGLITILKPHFSPKRLRSTKSFLVFFQHPAWVVSPVNP